jgi:hypothetical protein
MIDDEAAARTAVALRAPGPNRRPDPSAGDAPIISAACFSTLLTSIRRVALLTVPSRIGHPHNPGRYYAVLRRQRPRPRLDRQPR